MDPEVTPEQLEQERLEQRLFIDLVRLAPAGATLGITPDSWQGLPALFGEQMIIQPGEWIVPLVPATREFLVQQALLENIQTKFVHFHLVAQDTELFVSYDGMCSLRLDERFPNYRTLTEEYAPILMQ
jgi:hypothetical protein